jgi:hypothetical protein
MGRKMMKNRRKTMLKFGVKKWSKNVFKLGRDKFINSLLIGSGK